ncbi:putative membrane protein [Sulfitobacter noctilucae]|uniref:sulfite exporter TauE/SafE family protein n=1 Tax=Sulfitobacter noctilucae TaxID=1342302 RepID=UPI000469AF8D|nr:sulfite exporter TauE/SafE family protein [Sulfitobacter noctilucae]KIN65263.1 putative membrane protein [Sulfitobacter noctilucae]
MDALFPFLGPLTGLLALTIAFCAGFVKGVVGFAMPLVLISGLTLFLAPELALAGLIIPTLMSNGVQALRQGPQAAWESIKAFRYFLMAGGVTLVLAAQMVRVVPEEVLLFAIGLPAFSYAALQLLGVLFSIKRRSAVVETAVGAVAGVMGGLAGVWGPPTVMYLTALGTPKGDQMRVQGVIYGMGAVALTLAHTGSGVLRAETLPFSLVLVLPALIGMWAGGKFSDRVDQRTFKRFTLIMLLIAGANLMRRALY